MLRLLTGEISGIPFWAWLFPCAFKQSLGWVTGCRHVPAGTSRTPSLASIQCMPLEPLPLETFYLWELKVSDFCDCFSNKFNSLFCTPEATTILPPGCFSFFLLKLTFLPLYKFLFLLLFLLLLLFRDVYIIYSQQIMWSQGYVSSYGLHISR